MHSAVSAELVVQAVPEAMVEQVEIHSRVSTSASLAEVEVSPASSKISSEVVAEASSRLKDSVPAILADLMVLPVMVAALMGQATELVLISVGENSYGHPSAETLERIAEAGAQVYRTDECGTITIRR